MGIDDCHHKAQMRKAPTYLHEIVDKYYFALRGLVAPGETSIRAPLREKFSYARGLLIRVVK